MLSDLRNPKNLDDFLGPTPVWRIALANLGLAGFTLEGFTTPTATGTVSFSSSTGDRAAAFYLPTAVIGNVSGHRFGTSIIIKPPFSSASFNTTMHRSMLRVGFAYPGQDCRFFVGMGQVSAAPTNVNPTLLPPLTFGFAQVDGSPNLHIILNGLSGGFGTNQAINTGIGILGPSRSVLGELRLSPLPQIVTTVNRTKVDWLVRVERRPEVRGEAILEWRSGFLGPPGTCPLTFTANTTGAASLTSQLLGVAYGSECYDAYRSLTL